MDIEDVKERKVRLQLGDLLETAGYFENDIEDTEDEACRMH